MLIISFNDGELMPSDMYFTIINKSPVCSISDTCHCCLEYHTTPFSSTTCTCMYYLYVEREYLATPLKREWAGSQDYAFCSTIGIYLIFCSVHYLCLCFADGIRSFRRCSSWTEDDVDFEPNFRDDLEQVLKKAHRLAPQWDLMSVKCSATLGNGCAGFFYLHRAKGGIFPPPSKFVCSIYIYII